MPAVRFDLDQVIHFVAEKIVEFRFNCPILQVFYVSAECVTSKYLVLTTIIFF